MAVGHSDFRAQPDGLAPCGVNIWTDEFLLHVHRRTVA